MLPLVVAAAIAGKIAGKIGIKAIKYFVDATFRDKVVPRPGSVVYCDLWVGAEHSGIYLGDGKISNIVVLDCLVESEVCLDGPASFTSKSKLGSKIYVSCDSDGAVGHSAVALRANEHVGERAFYGLVIKNCHQFSERCVTAVDGHSGYSSWTEAQEQVLDETWEPTMAALKRTARQKLGATKWRLWDWERKGEEREQEPDWNAHSEYFKNLPLNEEMIANLRAELAAAEAYEAEISDEDIPSHIRARLQGFRQTLADISAKFEEVKGFLAACRGASFSYADLQACTDDFAALASQLQSNPHIRELALKMGRSYISEEKKKQTRIPQTSRSEVHGTQRSDDVMRMLPSELVNLEDETLEVLFYARLLEKSLLSYELSGTTLVQGENSESQKKRTGPVVACLDTSGSMQGAPLLKAKALLLAIANILKQEDRSLHVLLFGGAGQIREFSMDAENMAADLLKFLSQGFGGGTDFEMPLDRAMKIIGEQPNYLKADVLMISDGDCNLSEGFATRLKQNAQRLDCSIYSVLCAGARGVDGFSDEVMVL